MARPRRNLSGISTRDAILSKAIDLFEERGFDNVTVDTIASEVGVTQRTIFRYFPTKAALVLDSLVFCYFISFKNCPPRISEATPLRSIIMQALTELSQDIESKREIVVRHATIVSRSPALAVIARQVGNDALKMLRTDLARYLDEPEDSAKIHVSAEVIYAAAFAARHKWMEDDSVAVERIMTDSLESAMSFAASLN